MVSGTSKEVPYVTVPYVTVPYVTVPYVPSGASMMRLACQM